MRANSSKFNKNIKSTDTVFQSIPKITKNLLLINLLAFLATIVLEMRGIDLAFWGGLHFFGSPYFHLYQFVSYQFLHGSFTHLFFNMFALWMFGCVIERVWGPRKFLIYYLACGIGAGLCQEVVQFLMGSYSLTIGASGADIFPASLRHVLIINKSMRIIFVCVCLFLASLPLTS